MTLSTADQLLLQRHLDGELAPPAAAAFAARLAAEPELAEHAATARALRAEFAGAASLPGPRPRAGFAAGVLAAIRQLPARELLQQAEQSQQAVQLCRRLLLAAMLLAGLGLLWGSGLIDGGSAAQLQAAPDEVQRELERLDALLRSAAEAPVSPRLGR